MVTIYSLPSCTKCKMIKTKLHHKGIEFDECDDLDTLNSLQIKNVPVLKTDTGEIIHDFLLINKIVNEL